MDQVIDHGMGDWNAPVPERNPKLNINNAF